MNQAKLKIVINQGYLANEVMKKGVYDVFTDRLLDLAEEFQKNSPVGATKNLKDSWDVTRPKKEAVTFNIKASITNTSEAALNRIAGRPPGKRPPIEPLTDWVIAKGIATDRRKAKAISFAIAKKIEREGTQRHKEKTNWVGIDRFGKRIKGGRIEQAELEIAKELQSGS